jgi:antirestriction protein ArdC
MGGSTLKLAALPRVRLIGWPLRHHDPKAADTITKKDTDDKGADIDIEITFMKGYTVFNAEQVDGLPAHFYATVPPLNSDIDRLESAESFFASTKASIQHGGSSAFYSPGRDIVQMPELPAFRDRESYYATLAHEMTHNAEPSVMPRRSRFTR